MTTVREVIDAAMRATRTGIVTVTKRFLGEETYHTFDSADAAEQFIRNDIYNNIQMHMAPNVEMPVDVCGVFKFKVTPTLNSCREDEPSRGSLDYVSER